MSATDYGNAYTNADKTVLVEWVKAAIDNDYITFGDIQYETAYLALVDDLYDECADQDWNGCVTVSGQLETASQYISGSAMRAYVESIAEATADIYSETSYLFCMTDATESAIQSSLVNGPPSNSEVLSSTVHCAGCDTAEGTYHFVYCTIIIGDYP